MASSFFEHKEVLDTPDASSFGITSDEIERQQFLAPDSQDRPQKSLSQKLSSLYNDNIGLLLMIASSMFFTFMSFFVKLLTALDNPVPALELIWIRMVITYICGYAYMFCIKLENPITGPPEVRWLLVTRGISGFFSVFGMYFSLAYLSFSDAVVLTFLAPFFTGIAGTLFLKEKFTRGQILAGFFSLAGVVLIARPSSLFPSSFSDDSASAVRVVTSGQRVIAVGVALIGVCGSVATYTSLRAMGTKAHAMHSMGYFAIFSVIVSTIMIFGLEIPIVIPTQWKFLFFLLFVGLFGFIAQTLLALGLQRETASRGTIGVYTEIIFAGLLEQFVLHTTPSMLSVIGTIIILASASYVALTKTQDSSHSSTPLWANDIEFRDTISSSVVPGPEPETPKSF